VPKRSAVLLQVGLVFFGALSCASAQTNWKVEKTFHVGGEGGWDYVTVDGSNHRLFVTRSTHTLAIDTETGKILGDIPGQIRSHGVALVPKLGRGFITDGGGKGAILVFDLKTYAVIGRIPAMPDADGIIYDAKLDRVLAVSGDGKALMTFRPSIDPEHGSIDPPIDLGGSPEFLASDGSGKVYINLEDKDMVAVVDLQSRKVTARWPVTPAGRPVGMAIDPANHRLFIGARNPQKLVVMNAETGAIESTLPIGAGVDANAFSKGQAFSSCGDGTLVIAGKVDGSWGMVQTVKTAAGARTMGLDGANGRIYLPTAELEPQAAGRPKPKPGTFMIVVVGH
jgi:DNA-binding beta-propeller fold protein YncE